MHWVDAGRVWSPLGLTCPWFLDRIIRQLTGGELPAVTALPPSINLRRRPQIPKAARLQECVPLTTLAEQQPKPYKVSANAARRYKTSEIPHEIFCIFSIWKQLFSARLRLSKDWVRPHSPVGRTLKPQQGRVAALPILEVAGHAAFLRFF